MGCIGDYCQYKNVPVFICDKCEEEVDELYELDGDHYCLKCLLDCIGARKVEA